MDKNKDKYIQTNVLNCYFLKDFKKGFAWQRFMSCII